MYDDNESRENETSEWNWDSIPTALTSDEIAEVTAEIRF